MGGAIGVQPIAGGTGPAGAGPAIEARSSGSSSRSTRPNTRPRLAGGLATLPVAGGGERLLVVDDYPAAREFAAKYGRRPRATA